MDLFKLVGSIFINNSNANSQIQETTENAESLASKIGSAFQTAGSTITNVGKKLAPVSAICATALTASVKGASDFTDGMAKMSTLFDTTQTSVSELSKQFLDLSNKTGISATELAEAGYQALSASVDIKDVGSFVETAGNLAKTGFTSTTTAVDVLTTAMNAYGESAGTADDIANKLVRTQNLGKTTVDELASAMGKVIPTASSMNVGIDQLCSGYVVLTKQGIATAEATTYINSMFNELGDSGTTLGGVIKEKTGMSFQDCMKSGMSLADVLQITKQYADENNTAYNELWSSAEAGKAGLAILNGGVEEFNSTAETMASNTDDIGDALDKLETPSVQIKKALNEVKNSGIELGTAFISALMPTIEKIIDGIQKATTWFNNLDDKTKTTIATVVSVVAVASPVLILVGKFVSGIGSLITGIGKVISTMKLLFSVLLANPIGLVVVAITALVAGFIYLWNNCEEFRQFWINLWEGVKTVVSTVVEAVVGFFTGLWENIQNIFNTIATFISTVWETIKNVISLAGQFIVELVTAWFSLITLPWQFIWENCHDEIVAVWDAIKTVVTTVFNAIKEFITTVLNAIHTIFSTVWNAISSVVGTVVDTIKEKVTTVWNGIKTTVTTIMNGIKSVFTTVWNAIKSTVTNVINGIKTGISTALNAIKTTVSNILNGVKNTFSNVFNGIKSFLSPIINWLKGIFNFNWSLPKIKLPHFSITGSFSLSPPSIPHFSIEWYKKAMADPFMFTQPTLFDVNPVTGSARGAGEAGDEIMYGHDNLMNDIGNAVATNNNVIVQALEDLFNQMFDIFEEYFPQFSQELVLDTGLLVAETAEAMDEQLGLIYRRKGRR